MKTWTEAEELLREVGLAEIRRDRLEGKMNEEIATVTARYAERLAEIDRDLERAEGVLEAFCEEHRAEMKPASKKDDAGLVWKSVANSRSANVRPPSSSQSKRWRRSSPR